MDSTYNSKKQYHNQNVELPHYFEKMVRKETPINSRGGDNS